MRIAVIGSGISSLTSAHLLTRYDADVIVFEKSAQIGGRANIDHNGEHCPRIFLDDYDRFFSILREIPNNAGASLFDDLRRLRRLVRLRQGWVEASHLYRAFAPEVPFRERYRLMRDSRRLKLVAEESFGPNTNRYGKRKNYTMPHLLRLARNLFRSRVGFAFEGPNDISFLNPWADHLARSGVQLRTSTPVSRIVPKATGALVSVDTGEEHFDAVLITAYIPDAIQLLSDSALGHRLEVRPDIHCKVFTVTLDPREPILSDEAGPAIYCHGGINVVLQPRHHRCVALCTWSPSTDDEFVIWQLTEFFGLKHPIVSVRVRENQGPGEGVYAADPVDPARILRRSGDARHVHFAGSYLRTGYPLDSGESAVRSGFQAVERIVRLYGLDASGTVAAEGHR